MILTIEQKNYYYSPILFHYVWSFLHSLVSGSDEIRKFLYKIASESVYRPFLYIDISLKADLTCVVSSVLG